MVERADKAAQLLGQGVTVSNRSHNRAAVLGGGQLLFKAGDLLAHGVHGLGCFFGLDFLILDFFSLGFVGLVFVLDFGFGLVNDFLVILRGKAFEDRAQHRFNFSKRVRGAYGGFISHF